MKELIERKIAKLEKDKKTLENKRIIMNDIQLYREVYIEITLLNIQIEHLTKMIEEENYQIVL
jgi:hypothetical protein